MNNQISHLAPGSSIAELLPSTAALPWPRCRRVLSSASSRARSQPTGPHCAPEVWGEPPSLSSDIPRNFSLVWEGSAPRSPAPQRSDPPRRPPQLTGWPLPAPFCPAQSAQTHLAPAPAPSGCCSFLWLFSQLPPTASTTPGCPGAGESWSHGGGPCPGGV